MCGIGGVAGGALPAGREVVVRTMMDRLAHRGPDGAGLVADSRFVFGHRRLAIIDVESGSQPMQTADGRFTLVCNGEIYNYVELRRELERDGVRFRTRSDTEVLLELLARSGRAALDRVEGMFAFALHDGRDASVLLARDPFGIKPLYYAITRSTELVFASEAKALLAHPDIDARRSSTGLHHYLAFQLCLGSTTMFDGVSKLEPGCLAHFRPDRGIETVHYWEPSFAVDLDHTPSYFADQMGERLDASLSIQLRSDVPVGAFLSGGLDSSTVAALALRRTSSPIPVFHGRFEGVPGFDESHHARMVAAAIGADYHEVVPTAAQFVEDLPRLLYWMDEPAAGPGLFPQYRVAKLAAEHVKVVLSGQGGDEVFGGYARYVIGYLEQALKGAIFETQEEGRHLVSLASIIPNLPLLCEYVPLLKFFWSDGLFDPMDARYFRLISRFPDMERLVEPDACDERARHGVFEAFQAEFNHPDTRSYINKMTHFDLKTLLPALLQVEDRVSMAVSVESRVPLLDRRVVDLVTRMPPALKFGAGRTKHLLRAHAEGLLPDSVVNRRDKMGFPVPLSAWMAGGPVREFVRDLVLSTASRQRGIFRPEGLEKLVAKEAPFGRQLWGVLCLELWHRAFGIA
jgi:asparagine synthase (glutamine-hydrolysing)